MDPSPLEPKVAREDDTLAGAFYIVVTSRLLESGDPAWFTSAFIDARRASSDALRSSYAVAPTRIGRGRVVHLSDREYDVFRRAGCIPGPEGWLLEECARAALLVQAAHVSRDAELDLAALIREIILSGEPGEQQAALRVLAYLPGPERFTAIAQLAVRSAHQAVFEAIACENPFPARHLADACFARMIERCITLGLRLGRVEGISERIAPVLSCMSGDRVHAAPAGRASIEV